MLTQPKVSVVIPAYNEEFYIGRALDSVKNQTYPNIETIIVSNGSTDKTSQVAGLYTPNVYEMCKRGVSKARNLGIDKSSGEVIIFLDADSIMERNLIEKAVGVMHSKFAGGKSKVIPDSTSFQAKLYYSYVNFCSDLSQLLTYFNKNLLNGAGAFMFTDKDHIERLKYKYGKVFDEDLETMEDVDFLRKLRESGLLKFIKDSYVVTSTRRFNKEGYFNRFIQDYLEYISPKSRKRKAVR